MKDYKIKEALSNLTQAFNDLKEKFDVLIDVLSEYEAKE